jgi:hypothetical protein
MSYYYHSRSDDTTYDANSPSETWKRDRSKIAIATFGLENGIPPANKSCKECPSSPLIVITNEKTKNKPMHFCRQCGQFFGIVKEKPKPTKTKSKVLQKSSSGQNKTFITQDVGPTRKKEDGLHGFEDGTESLSDDELDYVSRIYGNITNS